jgi:ribonuclease Z
MDLDLVFLGTAGSVPTPGRGLASMLLRRGGERMLFDCGEGTQRQMMRSCGMGDIEVVLLTHLHADHVLGLPGMLKTFALRERETPLSVVGPSGTAAFFRLLQPVIGRLSYDLDVEEVPGGGEAWSGPGYVVDAVPTEHSVRSLGYALREFDRPGQFDLDAARALGVPEGPAFGRLQRGQDVELEDGTIVRPAQVLGEARSGRTVVYSGDTRACRAIREASAGANVLVHEATFALDEVARSVETGHSTAHDAAITAAAADVDMLALTHVSTRYLGRELLAEARDVFPNTVLPRDFDIIEVPFAERGPAVHVPGGARQPRAARAASAPEQGAAADPANA